MRVGRRLRSCPSALVPCHWPALSETRGRSGRACRRLSVTVPWVACVGTPRMRAGKSYSPSQEELWVETCFLLWRAMADRLVCARSYFCRSALEGMRAVYVVWKIWDVFLERRSVFDYRRCFRSSVFGSSVFHYVVDSTKFGLLQKVSGLRGSMNSDNGPYCCTFARHRNVLYRYTTPW